MAKKHEIAKSPIDYLLYMAEGMEDGIQVVYKDQTVWATQKAMATLFGCTTDNIGLHLKNIFNEGELDKEATTEKFSVVQNEGGREVHRNPVFYNLDAIISVGYRVSSIRATRFRQWATTILDSYIRKGFALDDDRLKELGGGGYWKELLLRIRDIRASEKVFYRQVLDIYATSIDYDPTAGVSKAFFKKVQNKMHFAVHGQTAAEVIYSRADAEKEFMGLTTFRGDRPHLVDALIAKNYLDEKELKAIGQIVSGYLDFAERQADREIPMTMEDWAKHLDSILTSTGENLLQGAGSISHKQAGDKATGEYKKYQQRTLSDVESSFLDSIEELNIKAKK